MTGAHTCSTTSGAPVASGRGVVATGLLPELARLSGRAAFPQLVLPSASDDGMAGCGGVESRHARHGRRFSLALRGGKGRGQDSRCSDRPASNPTHAVGGAKPANDPNRMDSAPRPAGEGLSELSTALVRFGRVFFRDITARGGALTLEKNP